MLEINEALLTRIGFETPATVLLRETGGWDVEEVMCLGGFLETTVLSRHQYPQLLFIQGLYTEEQCRDILGQASQFALTQIPGVIN